MRNVLTIILLAIGIVSGAAAQEAMNAQFVVSDKVLMSPPGLNILTKIVLIPDDADHTINAMPSRVSAAPLTIVNSGTGGAIILKNKSSLAGPDNAFSFNADLRIPQLGSAKIKYVKTGNSTGHWTNAQ